MRTAPNWPHLTVHADLFELYAYTSHLSGCPFILLRSLNGQMNDQSIDRPIDIWMIIHQAKPLFISLPLSTLFDLQSGLLSTLDTPINWLYSDINSRS